MAWMKGFGEYYKGTCRGSTNRTIELEKDENEVNKVAEADYEDPSKCRHPKSEACSREEDTTKGFKAPQSITAMSTHALFTGRFLQKQINEVKKIFNPVESNNDPATKQKVAEFPLCEVVSDFQISSDLPMYMHTSCFLSRSTSSTPVSSS